MSVNAKSIQFYVCGIAFVFGIIVCWMGWLWFEWNNNRSKSFNLFWYFYRKNILKLIWLGNCTDVLNFNSDIKFCVCVGRIYVNIVCWIMLELILYGKRYVRDAHIEFCVRPIIYCIWMSSWVFGVWYCVLRGNAANINAATTIRKRERERERERMNA